MKDKPAPKKSLRILNTREKKEINQKLEAQWGVSFDKDMVFLLSNKDRLYVAERDIDMIDMENLRIDNLGLYVCNVSDKGVRLTIEGAQMLGPKATKNVVDIDDSKVKEWFRGNDIEVDTKDTQGYVIVKNNDDFLGCGRVSGDKILNFVPKTRRILSSD